MQFHFKNNQPFSKYYARKVKFRQFTCIKIRIFPRIKIGFTCIKMRLFFFIQNISGTNKVSLNSRQSTESDEIKVFRKKNWEKNKSVLSAPEISLDATIKIERERK